MTTLFFNRAHRAQVSRPTKLTFRCKVASVLLLIGLFTHTSAQVEPRLSSEKMAAVMSVIGMLLLDDEGPRVETLNLNGLEDAVVTRNSPFTGTFGRQSADIEFCFNVPFGQSGALELKINGITQTGRNKPRPGENCYVIPVSQQRAQNSVEFSSTQGIAQLTLIGIQRLDQNRYGLPTLSRSQWGDVEVRKVLKIFAFGGHATDSQIAEWARMPALTAIAEMLNFNEHNLKLSPLAQGEKYTESAFRHGTLDAWQKFISSQSSDIPIPLNRREQYGVEGYNFDDGYGRMITVRGLNPFRQRIGFWETNYHLATNLDSSVSERQMVAYYDLIMKAHEAGLPYKDVMGAAAKSAAIAMQYGHRRNKWDDRDKECDCNEDFAREISQLFYGIFGLNDPNHETVTIPETAKMLTGMPVEFIRGFGRDIKVDFAKGVADGDHHLNPVTIFGRSIAGANAAAKIDNLMPISMQHPESLRNLPVMIISVLADDNLDEPTRNQLRAAWRVMGVNRNFLNFIHAYATSTVFHNPRQLKYFTTHERALYIANKFNLDNLEAYFGSARYDGGRAGVSIGGVIREDFAGDFFEPLNNVFGGQTSAAASDSAVAFEKNYNLYTDDENRHREAVLCDTCDLGQPWLKKWETVLPKRADGQYYVADAARWLWRHAVGDMSSYTELERAHLYSLLGAARIEKDNRSDGDSAFDFNLVMCVVTDYQRKEGTTNAPILDILEGRSWDDYCRSDDDLSQLNVAYTGAQIAASPMIQGILRDLGNQTLPLNATSGANDGKDLRRHSRERLNSALGFIFTTPFVFAEGQ